MVLFLFLKPKSANCCNFVFLGILTIPAYSSTFNRTVEIVNNTKKRKKDRFIIYFRCSSRLFNCARIMIIYRTLPILFHDPSGLI